MLTVGHQRLIIALALRATRRLSKLWVVLKPLRLPLPLLAFVLGCDAFRPQFVLQAEIKREFQVAQAVAFVIDTTNMLVMVFDDARAAGDPKERAAFLEHVAAFAVTRYKRGRLSSVGVALGKARRTAGEEPPPPTFFMPEYHPDGSVRVALLSAPAAVEKPASGKP